MWRHHRCRILLLSPQDSPVDIQDPQIFACLHAGKSEYGGVETIARERAYLWRMMDCLFKYYFVCDTDCYCLSPEFPAELYRAPEVVWSILESDAGYPRPVGYSFPRWAFQTPWFIPRVVLPKLLAQTERTVFVPGGAWGDNDLMQLTVLAGIEYRALPGAISCAMVPDNMERVRKFIRDGGIFVHSVKDPAMTQEFVDLRKQHLMSKLAAQPA